MTPDEMRAALRRTGANEDAIERAIERHALRLDVPPPAEASATVIAWPLRITLPWSALCSDNERATPYVQIVRGTPVARAKMTARYKAARATVVRLAREAMQGAAPFDGPLALVASVYTPTQRRVDVANFAKGVHDALNGIVFSDDRWLWDVRWRRAGMDVDAPRVELEVRPL